MTASLGLGLTNACNLSCAHCYRPKPPLDYLSREAVRAVCDSIDVGGVNLGTGENALHPQFREIVDDLLERGLRVSLTSNGYSIGQLPDEVLTRLNDIEVSVDFPDRERFDAFRGAGAWETAWAALDRCRDLGLGTTVLAVMMKSNHRDLSALAAVAAEHGAPLRVNVYQPVHSTAFVPTYDQFWTAIRDLLDNTTLIACTEPVVRAALGLPRLDLKCGATSMRITPGGQLLPCVYWPDSSGDVSLVVEHGDAIFDLPQFSHLGQEPQVCRDCDYYDNCGGGCASRRRLAWGTLAEPDPYCPKKQGIRLTLPARDGDDAGRLHTGNVCTLLVRG